MADSIPITELDITKEVMGMEKWLAKCLVLEGKSFDSADSIKTALYHAFPNHDWIAKVLSGFKHQKNVPDLPNIGKLEKINEHCAIVVQSHSEDASIGYCDYSAFSEDSANCWTVQTIGQ